MLEITDEQEKEIREKIFSVLKILGRKDVVDQIERAIPEMEKDGCENQYKIKDYAAALFDVTREAL